MKKKTLTNHKKLTNHFSPIGFALLIIFVLSFLIAGCAGGQKAKDKEQVIPEDFNVGIEGVYMEFMPNSPPPKIYVEDPSALTVLVKVQNKGAYDIKPGEYRFVLLGHDQGILPMAPDRQLSDILYGKSEVYPQGEMDFAGWKANSIMEFPGDSYSPVFQATACYHYETKATPIVCVDPNPYSALAQDKVCVVRDILLSGGQGGPVAVTKIEESVLRNKIIFRIYITNMQSSGIVLAPSTPLEKCVTKRLGVTDIDKVIISGRLGTGGVLSCNPNEIMLINGRGFATCEVSIGLDAQQAAYTTQLELRLRYGYSSSIQRPVKIVRTGMARGTDRPRP